MYVRGIVDFPYIKIVGEIKEKENYITFRGINGDMSDIKNGKNAETAFFTFVAFGDMKERIKRLKVQKFSEVRIGAYIRKYINGDRDRLDYSFEVIAIDYIITSRRSDKDEAPRKKPAEEKAPVEVIDNTDENSISIKELEEMFGQS